MYAIVLMASASASEPPTGAWQAGPRLEEMKAEVAAEVETYVSELGLVRRKVARWALLRATAPCSQVEIDRREEGVAVTCDDHATAVAPADGRKTSFTGDDGRTLSLTHRMEGDALVQTFAGKQGTRTNRFVPNDSGGLEVEVTVKSPRLDEPFRYRLRYER